MPRVTVLSAVKDGASHLAQTIASIQAQSYADFEYIIVDDASRDGTAALVAEAARSDPRIRLVRRDTSGGPFVAANDGLRVASGELVIRTDGDDISLPQRIARQVELMDGFPRLLACATYTRALGDRCQVRHIPTSAGALKWALCLDCLLVHSSLCLRREPFLARGGYRELPVAQDYRLFCELSREGSIAVVPELHVLFRMGHRRLSSTHAREQRARSLEILSEHLRGLHGGFWSDAELTALEAVGSMRRWPLGPALRALARWDASWAADQELSVWEHEQLWRQSQEKRRAFLRRNAKAHPLGLIANLRHVYDPSPRVALESGIPGTPARARWVRRCDR